MKRILLILSMSAAILTSMAQRTVENRERWDREMKQYKHEFMTKALDLSGEQQTRFLALYDAMENEKRAVFNDYKRQRAEIDKRGNAVTDAEYEKAAENSFQLKLREGAIEMKYFKEFKTVLNKRQLYKLKGVEKDFFDNLRKHRKHSRGKGKKN